MLPSNGPGSLPAALDRETRTVRPPGDSAKVVIAPRGHSADHTALAEKEGAPESMLIPAWHWNDGETPPNQYHNVWKLRSYVVSGMTME